MQGTEDLGQAQLGAVALREAALAAGEQGLQAGCQDLSWVEVHTERESFYTALAT